MRVNTKGGVPPRDRRPDRRKVAIAAVAALFLFAAAPAMAVPTTFTVDPGLSFLSTSQTFDLSEVFGPGSIFTTVAQFPGSDVAVLSGTVEADVSSPGFITPAAGGLVKLWESTGFVNPAPGVAGIPGAYNPAGTGILDPDDVGGPTAPPGGINFSAQLGSKIDALSFFLSINGLALDPFGSFDPTPRALGVGGDFGYSVGVDLGIGLSGSLNTVDGLLGGATNSNDSLLGSVIYAYGVGPGTPNYSVAGTTGTLTLPIASAFPLVIDLEAGGPGSGPFVTVTAASGGVIVATAEIPEPSSFVLLGFGLIGLVTCGWRAWKRRA